MPRLTAHRAIVPSLLAVATITTPLAAQGPPQAGLRNLPPPTYVGTSFYVDPPGTQTHWKEGMIIGGLVGIAVGFLGVSANKALCESSDCRITPYYFIGPILVFSILGGMIGDASHKKE